MIVLDPRPADELADVRPARAGASPTAASASSRIDLLGHGGSDAPGEQSPYAMTAFAEQVVALLDHPGSIAP